MDVERQEVTQVEVEVEAVEQGHQLKQLKHQQYYVMTMHYAKVQKLMPFSIHPMVLLMLLRKKSTIDSQRMQLRKVTLKQLPKDGPAYQMESMLHSLTRTARLTSSKDQNTGDIMEGILTVIIQRR